jgi:hypothetical protein
MSEQKIYNAICAAMKDIGPIAKNRKNTQHGFQYRGVDDVMTELSPILVKHGIFIVPEVLEHRREERQTKSGSCLNYSIQKAAFHFTADDGSSVTATVIGEGMDSGDKASNKALSIAFKYACLQIFCIPTEDSKAPDAESPPPSFQVKAAGVEKPVEKPPRREQSPKEAAEIRYFVEKISEVMTEEDPSGRCFFTEEEKDSVRNLLRKSYSSPQKISIMKGLLDKWTEELQNRKLERDVKIIEDLAILEGDKE